ncbi:MAG: tetratricopeptide repeat protein [Candidatus Eisenbacteria bacterium]|nr:tetratricopeptide repeat protein [Candidatus Eisenbacteria bacterium]
MKKSLNEWVLSISSRIENLEIGLGRWLLFLASIIVLRHFLEQVSGQQKTLYFLSYFLHYPLAYIAPLLALSVVLALLSRERIARVTRLMLFAWLLTLLPPVLDLLVPSAGDAPELIGYLIPKDGSIGRAFLNLLNPTYHDFQGTTVGIRLEAALGCLLGAWYVFLKTRNVLRSVLSFFVIYVTMFFFFALPPITLALVNLFGGDIENVYQLFFARADIHRAFANVTPFALSDLSNSLVDLFVVTPVLILWYRLHDAGRFAADVRELDLVHAVSMPLVTFAGLAFGARLLMQSEGLLAISHPFDAISIIGLLAASCSAGLTVSSLRRLTATPAGNPERGRRLIASVFLFSLSTLFALSVSYVALTYVLGVLSIFYFYYAPPFELRRFTPLAELMIASALFFAFLLGYGGYAGGAAALWTPRTLVVVTLVSGALVALSRGLWEDPKSYGFGWNLGSLKSPATSWIAASCVLIACALPGALLGRTSILIAGLIAGAAGFVLTVTLRKQLLAPALLVVGAALLVSFQALGLADLPVLRSELDDTSFAQVTRSSGTFEMVDESLSPEQQRRLSRGIEMFRAGDFEGAVEAFREAIEADPEYGPAYVSLGTAYMRLDRLAEAARVFRRAIEIDPENASAHVGLGQTLKLQSNPDAAIEALEKALELDPSSADAAYTLALTYLDTGDLEQELEYLERTIAINPRNSLAQSRLADIYLSQERYPEAIQALRAALTGDQRVEHAHTRLAQAYYRMGDLERAEQELRKEIIVSPKSPSPRANLSSLLAETGRIDEAIREMEKAIELSERPRLRAAFEQELERLRSEKR